MQEVKMSDNTGHGIVRSVIHVKKISLLNLPQLIYYKNNWLLHVYTASYQ